MLVYGHHTVGLNVPAFVGRFRQRLECLPNVPPHDTVIALLVDWGEAESAVADALLPECDDDLEDLVGWRRVSDAVAEAVCASVDQDGAELAAALARARVAIAPLLDWKSPREVRAKTAEGFAHFAVYPEQYIAAARRFAGQIAPGSLLCIGLRSIGSILAHVVAAALRRQQIPAMARSLRPRGDPFQRRLEVSARLRSAIVGAQVTHFAIVDEGPGLSGSSIAAAADFLVEKGIPARRVVLFPSWQPAVEALRSPNARATWARHATFTVTFEEVGLANGRLFGRIQVDADLSAGEWRRRCFPSPAAWPATQPQHERRKYSSGRRILRFAGLGRRGESLEKRARILGDAGFGAGALRLENGFLHQRWIEGSPLAAGSAVSAGTLDRLASYLAFTRRTFATGADESVDEVLAMAAANSADTSVQAHALDQLAVDARSCSGPRVALDGRMLPHDWIDVQGQLMKVDALDHHDDDFWPGCREIAWDVAGVIVEFDFGKPAVEYLLSAYQRASGDAAIRRRLRFYEAAYLAYRHAYATLAAETLGDSPDGRAFTRLGRRYRRSLAARLGHSRRVSRC
jgi:hypothetical protein